MFTATSTQVLPEENAVLITMSDEFRNQTEIERLQFTPLEPLFPDVELNELYPRITIPLKRKTEEGEGEEKSAEKNKKPRYSSTDNERLSNPPSLISHSQQDNATNAIKAIERNHSILISSVFKPLPPLPSALPPSSLNDHKDDKSKIKKLCSKFISRHFMSHISDELLDNPNKSNEDIDKIQAILDLIKNEILENIQNKEAKIPVVLLPFFKKSYPRKEVISHIVNCVKMYCPNCLRGIKKKSRKKLPIQINMFIPIPDQSNCKQLHDIDGQTKNKINASLNKILLADLKSLTDESKLPHSELNDPQVFLKRFEAIKESYLKKINENEVFSSVACFFNAGYDGKKIISIIKDYFAEYKPKLIRTKRRELREEKKRSKETKAGTDKPPSMQPNLPQPSTVNSFINPQETRIAGGNMKFFSSLSSPVLLAPNKCLPTVPPNVVLSRNKLSSPFFFSPTTSIEATSAAKTQANNVISKKRKGAD